MVKVSFHAIQTSFRLKAFLIFLYLRERFITVQLLRHLIKIVSFFS